MKYVFFFVFQTIRVQIKNIDRFFKQIAKVHLYERSKFSLGMLIIYGSNILNFIIVDFDNFADNLTQCEMQIIIPLIKKIDRFSMW